MEEGCRGGGDGCRGEGCRGGRLSWKGVVVEDFFVGIRGWCLLVFSGIRGVYRGVFLVVSVVSVVLLEWIQWSEHTAISKLEIARDFSLQAGSPQPQCHA